jgi:hypothetical protein
MAKCARLRERVIAAGIVAIHLQTVRAAAA